MDMNKDLNEDQLKALRFLVLSLMNEDGVLDKDLRTRVVAKLLLVGDISEDPKQDKRKIIEILYDYNSSRGNRNE